MCYSAQVIEAYDEYCDQFGADIDIEAFAQLYGMKLYDNRAKTTPALDAAIKSDKRAEIHKIREAVELYQAQQVAKVGQELLEQRDRLAKAELTLKTKLTKKATEDKRIATNKIERALEKLDDLQSVKRRVGD